MKLHRSSLATITCLAAMSLSGWQPHALAGSEPRHATSSVRGVYDLDGNLIDSFPDHTPCRSILSVPGSLLQRAAIFAVAPVVIVVGSIGILREEAKKAKIAAAEPPAKATPAKRRVRRR